MILSESDSDSDDVLFEHRKSKSDNHIRNGKSRNGFIKVHPRVKTWGNKFTIDNTRVLNFSAELQRKVQGENVRN